MGGHLSSTGRCFDIGTTTAAALRWLERTGDPFAGSTEATAAGNGSLMRLAPIPVHYFGRADDAIARAAESSRTTHGAAVAIDACRYLAALITGALQGADKDALRSPRYSPTPGYWNAAPLHSVRNSCACGCTNEILRGPMPRYAVGTCHCIRRRTFERVILPRDRNFNRGLPRIPRDGQPR